LNIPIHLNIPSPVQKIEHPLYDARRLEVFIKREDLIHPEISGNKWRKLKYNIQFALENNKRGIITFGGAFSNHIYATAHACHQFGLQSICYVRGLHVDLNNPTLSSIRQAGGKIIPLEIARYKEKGSQEFLSRIQTKYPNYHIVPEGGDNILATQGVKEMITELYNELLSYDVICVSAGTGNTASSMLLADLYRYTNKLLVFSSLKGNFLGQEIQSKLKNKHLGNWSMVEDYHFGGYAKTNEELVSFINTYYKETQVLLEPIYTAKMFFGLHDMIEQGKFAETSKILLIHTGGLQGIDGHNMRYKDRDAMQIKKPLA